MNTWQKVKTYFGFGDTRKEQEGDRNRDDPMQIFLQPWALERFVHTYGFHRFPHHRDDVYGSDVLSGRDGKSSFVALPKHVNMYQRGMEQDSLFFRMLGPVSIRVKGEFLFFDPELPFLSLRYFHFTDFTDIMHEKPFLVDPLNLGSLESRLELIERIKKGGPVHGS